MAEQDKVGSAPVAPKEPAPAVIKGVHLYNPTPAPRVVYDANKKAINVPSGGQVGPVDLLEVDAKLLSDRNRAKAKSDLYLSQDGDFEGLKPDRVPTPAERRAARVKGDAPKDAATRAKADTSNDGADGDVTKQGEAEQKPDEDAPKTPAGALLADLHSSEGIDYEVFKTQAKVILGDEYPHGHVKKAQLVGLLEAKEKAAQPQE
jgi:hypothetical protein